MFQGLTKAVAAEAVLIVRPTINQFLQTERTGGRHNLYLVILEPGSGHVLYQHSFGDDKSNWKYPYWEGWTRRLERRSLVDPTW